MTVEPNISANAALKNRSLDEITNDISAVQALIQACVNVELFTIPLYMTSLYSITGMHEINSSNAMYKGRIWPGSAAVTKPGSAPVPSSEDAPGAKSKANEQAYNTIYSVFIEEMLHLQLASNLASSIGVAPTFTSPLLQSKNSGWICYGDDLTVIPHILDLKDTKKYKHVKVKLGPVDKNQLDLFLAIEEPEWLAKKELGVSKHKESCQIEACNYDKYFPAVPFVGWKENYDETKLPLFGSIGYMYECLKDYLSIEYEGGLTLWEQLYNPLAEQRDQFNKVDSGHPYKEYPGFDAELGVYNKENARQNAEEAKAKAFQMIDAITDQGEGSGRLGAIAEAIEGLIKKIGELGKEGECKIDFKAVNTFSYKFIT